MHNYQIRRICLAGWIRKHKTLSSFFLIFYENINIVQIFLEKKFQCHNLENDLHAYRLKVKEIN